MAAFTKHFADFVTDGASITGKIGNTNFTATIKRDPRYNIDEEVFSKHKWWHGLVQVTAERDGWTKQIGTFGTEVNYPTGNNNHLMEVANEIVAEEFAEEFAE